MTAERLERRRAAGKPGCPCSKFHPAIASVCRRRPWLMMCGDRRARRPHAARPSDMGPGHACLQATEWRTATTTPRRRCRFGHRKQFRLRDDRSDGADQGVANAGPSTNVSQGDEFELQRGASTNPEQEQGAEGGQKREHADDGMTAAPKTLRFLGVLEI